MVLPLASAIVWICESAGTYQYSLEPELALPMARSGAPLPKAPITAAVPSPTPMSTLPEITACRVSALPLA